MLRTIPHHHTIHLCIADVAAENPAYAEFYQERRQLGDYIILDTAAFEGEANLDRLYDAVATIQPQEVVLPDDLESAKNTLKKSTDAMSDLRDGGYRGSFMVVPHGPTMNEWFRCCEMLLSHCYESYYQITVGIVEEIKELYGVPRSDFIQRVWERLGPQRLHLLGVTESLSEWMDPFVRRVVRSCDTSKLVVWGLNGVILEEGDPIPAYPGRDSVGGRTGYFDYKSPDVSNIVRATKNVEFWRSLY